MPAIVILTDPSSTLDLIGNASGPVLMAFILWSGIIKSPPLWVTWREHQFCKTDAAKWEALAMKGAYLAGTATDAVEEAKTDEPR